MTFIVEAGLPHAPFNSYVLGGTFNAFVHDRVAMAPDELASAGLEKYANG